MAVLRLQGPWHGSQGKGLQDPGEHISSVAPAVVIKNEYTSKLRSFFSKDFSKLRTACLSNSNTLFAGGGREDIFHFLVAPTSKN